MSNWLWDKLEASLKASENFNLIAEHASDFVSSPASTWTGSQILSFTAIIADQLKKHEEEKAEKIENVPPIVAIYLDRSAAFVCSALAAVKSRWAFLPLDIRWPRHRIDQAMQMFKPSAFIYAQHGDVYGAYGCPYSPSSSTTASDFPYCTFSGISPTMLAEGLRLADERQAAKDNGHRLDYVSEDNAVEREEEASEKIESSIVYLMMTSGSTGKGPQGVCGTTFGIFHRCKWIMENYPLEDNDKLAFKTNPAFVDSIAEIFLPVLSLQHMVIPHYETVINYKTFGKYIFNEKVTHLTAVPTVWNDLADLVYAEGQPWLFSIKCAIISGEQLTCGLLKKLRGVMDDPKVLNLYGTTEVAGDATFNCVNLDCIGYDFLNKRPNEPVPVGQPLSEAIVMLAKLNEDGTDADKLEFITVDELRSEDMVGEVFIGGFGLAAGYFPLEDGDDGKFVTVGFDDIEDCLISGKSFTKERYLDESGCIRLFQTGDLGKFDGRNGLTILGRLDLQVKIRGLRVNILEVEETLSRHRAVHAVAVKAWPSTESAAEQAELILVAYVELNKELCKEELTWEVLQPQLEQWCVLQLPIAATPSKIVQLETMPRSPGGKIDRSGLPSIDDLTIYAPSRKRKYPDKAVSPQFSEVLVHAVFAQTLGRKDFEPTENLFEIGGTSVHAVKVANLLEIEVERVFQHPTVRSLAASPWEGTSCSSEQRPSTGVLNDIPDTFTVLWRTKLLDCVDAIALSCQQYSRIFAASHGGMVACLDAASGAILWENNYSPKQPDPGMVFVPKKDGKGVLAVGFNSGEVLFLDPNSGAQNFNAGADMSLCGLRAAPAVDPWANDDDFGYVWAAGHGEYLQVKGAFSPDSIAQFKLPAPVSAGLAFTPDGFCRPTVYVGCLNGSLIGVQAYHVGDSAPRKLILERNLSMNCQSPIFSTPMVIYKVRSPEDSPLITECYVVVFTSAGEAIFREAIRGKSFDPGFHKLVDPSGFFIPPIWLPKDKAIVAGSYGGSIFWINEQNGATLKKIQISSAAITGLLIIEDRSAASGTKLIAATALGEVFVINSRPDPTISAQDTILSMHVLPEPTFSLALGPKPNTIAVGCRDDHLYLLKF